MSDKKVGGKMPRTPSLAAVLTAAAALTLAATRVAAPTEQTAARPGSVKALARNVASFATGTFLENLFVGEDGWVLVTSYLEGKVYKIEPGGAVTTFATLPGTIAGIAPDAFGGFLVVGWKDKKAPSVFHVSATGELQDVTPLPGALFPNGIAHLQDTRYLIADSYRGLVWEYDVARARSKTWLADSLLARPDTTNPTPGVNGVRRHGGYVYLTSTQRGMLLRVPVDATGRPGALEVQMRGLNVDDFAVADGGIVYAATHVLNTVARIDSAGHWTTIAGIDEGVTGSTSVALGTRHDDTRTLYVTTNGGMTAPPPGGVQRARLVELDLGSWGGH